MTASTGWSIWTKSSTSTNRPIGRTPRSNPATYTGVFSDIREIFAKTQDAKARGYGPGRFSFNVQGRPVRGLQRRRASSRSRCTFCRTSMFPATCASGKRYNRETLEVKYKGKNINDVLGYDGGRSAGFLLKTCPRSKRSCRPFTMWVWDISRSANPPPRLSGGEAQRVKLATELAKRQHRPDHLHFG